MRTNKYCNIGAFLSRPDDETACNILPRHAVSFEAKKQIILGLEQCTVPCKQANLKV